MNDTVVARPCWTVLTKKAEDRIALIQNQMVQARQRLESLNTSQQRIQKMYDELFLIDKKVKTGGIQLFSDFTVEF